MVSAKNISPKKWKCSKSLTQKIDIPKGSLEQWHCPAPKQSANTLFNFMRHFDYLKAIIHNKAIIPRYVNEDIRYLHLDVDSLSIPMTCFCDINMQRIESHTKRYGKYGIAFHKDWSIRQGIQPIHYINPYSFILEDFQDAFVRATNYAGDDESVETMQSYLLCHLAFMKPLYGSSSLGSTQNFHDEREWRYVPILSKIGTDMPPLLWGSNNSPSSRDTCNQGLKFCSGSWLHFEWENIRYILLPDSTAVEKMIAYIEKSKRISPSDKYMLYTKLICLGSLKEDI